MIRPVELKDAKDICDIYNYYVLESIATFETEPITVKDIEHKINEITKKYNWIVNEDVDGKVIGYAYLSMFRVRAAYQYTAESSVYVDVNQRGKGIGKLLYSELLKLFHKSDLHAVMGCISLPNDASVKLHEEFGFVQVAYLKEVGQKFNKWIDVGYWELTK